MRRVVVTGMGIVSSIGNTAEEVLQTATTSVLAVKPTDFVSPVTVPKVA